MSRQLLYYGGIPVPYAASWTAEKGTMKIGRCEHTGQIACVEEEKRGEGKPMFGKPHMNRQREVVIKDLCDLCAKPLKMRTKVSLSHARVVATGGAGPAVMQVEPMLHKECALICMKHCPSLKRDVVGGTLHIRQVTKWRTQLAILTPDSVLEFCGVKEKAIGHAKVELISWMDRDLEWLESAAR